MKTTLATIIAFLSLSHGFAQAPITWEHPNGPYGGVIYSLVDDGEGRLFAGTEGDGIFMSEDNGETWVETNVGITNFIVYTLAVNQQGQVFAGTEGGGIFRLNTGGTSWIAVNNGLLTPGGAPAVVNSIAFNDSGHVFAGLLFRGIYRSTDNGESWTEINTGLGDNIDIFALAVNENNELFASTLVGGVYCSTDNGDSWSARGLNNERIYTFLTLPNGEIFAGRFRSTNNGVSWAQTSPVGITPGTFWSLLRTAGGAVYASTSTGVYEFTAPSTWTEVGAGLPDMAAFSIIQHTGGDYFVGTGGRGVYKLENGSSAWQQKTAGITNIDVRAMARGNGNDVYVATFWSGIFRSTDNGASWLQTNAGPEVLWPVSLVVTPTGTILAGTWYVANGDGGKIFRSEDNGQTWSQVLQAHQNSDVLTFAVMPNGNIFAGTRSLSDSLYKSTNDGQTWGGVITANLTSKVIFSLSVNPSGHLFAGTLQDGLMRSEDSGANWISAQNGLPVPQTQQELYPQVQTMIFHNGVAYAGTHGSKGVYKSTTNGDSWTEENTGLPFVTYTRSLAVNQDGDMFAGTENGVFRMVKNSGNWSNIYSTNGLGNTFVRSLVVTASGHVLAGTYGSGIFRTTGVTTGVQQLAADVPLQFSLEQNYPNPFNPKTNIEFLIAKSGPVTLKVFDLLGKEISTVVSEELQPGAYSIPWDASAFPSGTYFYRLQAGSFTDTKKAVLLK
ncbi:MAG TPA: T9SS type A sorting domain-containing protein [Bacteroidota bacterium]